MVTKRIRSEYMKKFKDPQWETYTKCYEEMLAYRLTRRLLEHTHNPWFWSGSDSDSDSGGRSPPHPSENQVEASGGRAEAETEEAVGVKVVRHQEQETRTTGAGPGHTVQNEVQIRPDPLSSAHKKEPKGRQQRKPSKSTRQAWRSQHTGPASTGHLTEDPKKSPHPFALYGSGEKDADIAGRKTHNVGPAASTAEIHESALRAKARRQVERQIKSRRTERRRAQSADPNKAGRVVQPEFNPWLTEYMRCFSARSR
ncbi:centriole, cilia and spindle-associated protein [Girardinichthys multiradiatus]|uniref:centriole, cilia and spindle-associated protein n=1 Tax=Girardinichthys multiradiatus TaxID=208333 RepID=UPI001FABA7BF|nr:centriole, cilia and spindle-associated protein [Girardinichthys multiradiatus]XP_047220009.1 centriole, cilia and spindle-associated protein [Girardinichthys multiradiatus]XP_047220010.1 centriole, cilia and spindle-associated protein [Girardinichthys multiradiatus]XP_047220011.1 centriole, cilia and spindle-associated protein [Girardinichthys multiradiatus]